MRARKISFDLFGGPQPDPARKPIEHWCEAAGCGETGSFGFREPGFAALRLPCRWFCFEHRHLGRAA